MLELEFIDLMNFRTDAIESIKRLNRDIKVHQHMIDSTSEALAKLFNDNKLNDNQLRAYKDEVLGIKEEKNK